MCALLLYFLVVGGHLSCTKSRALRASDVYERLVFRGALLRGIWWCVVCGVSCAACRLWILVCGVCYAVLCGVAWSGVIRRIGQVRKTRHD